MHRLIPDFSSASPTGGDFVSARDAVALLEVAAIVGAVRRDPRAWRVELLNGLCRLLNASVAAAFVLKQIDADLIVTTTFDVGFKSERQKKALHEEFAIAPFRDPLSRAALIHFLTARPETYTALRADLVDDDAWTNDSHVRTYRRGSGLGDCVLSIHRATDKSTAYVLMLFRHAVTEPAPGTPASGTDVVGAGRFTWRERALLDVLHRGIGAFYHAEEASGRSAPPVTLTPRLRETLDHLLAGLTERQAAAKMNISVHTVHDDVKRLYAHFGVSSRGELLAKWISTTGKSPTAR